MLILSEERKACVGVKRVTSALCSDPHLNLQERRRKTRSRKAPPRLLLGSHLVHCLPRGRAGTNFIGAVHSLTEELWRLQALSSLDDITQGFEKQDASGGEGSETAGGARSFS